MVSKSAIKTWLGLAALAALAMGAIYGQPSAYQNPQDVSRGQGVAIALVAVGSGLGLFAVA